MALVPPKSAWLSVQDASLCTHLVEAEVEPFVLGVALALPLSLASARLSLSRVDRSGAGRPEACRFWACRSGAGRFVS